MTDTTCYAITCGEYSDYGVCAVFTTKAAAEAALPAYLDDPDSLDDPGSNYYGIEEFPLEHAGWRSGPSAWQRSAVRLPF
jgi:hypothetical protein